MKIRQYEFLTGGKKVRMYDANSTDALVSTLRAELDELKEAIAEYDEVVDEQQAEIDELKTGTRLEAGNGKMAIYTGTIEDVPCLLIGNNGTGILGEKLDDSILNKPLQEGVEIVSITFLNTGAVDVFITHLNEVREALLAKHKGE